MDTQTDSGHWNERVQQGHVKEVVLLLAEAVMGMTLKPG
jgi:hypothetical protein